MLTEKQVRILLGDIENERIERTVSTKDTDKFAKAVCAFANDLSNKRQPGYLLIGANDDGRLNGLKVTDGLLRNLAGLRADGNIQPKPALMVGKVSFSEGDVAIVEVQPSSVTPVKYKGVIYIRTGARKAEANEEEERILREKSEIKAPTFDTTPCTHSTIDDLDLDFFKKEYLPKFVKTNVLKRDKRTIKQQLASLRLFDLAFDCPTVAGILLIGRDPKLILFGSYIQYVQFAGRSRTSKVLNERQFSGNLLNMLKELDYFIKYTIQKQRPVFVTVLREEMKINYPYEAIRELVMNLVMHRNYQTNAPAKFYEYSDRLEMDNPGNLYGKVRPDNFPNENDYRNPVIANAMKIFGYINSFGRGINMVQEDLESNKNGLAVFNFDDMTTFKVTVMNADLEAVKALEDEAEMKLKNEAEMKLKENKKTPDKQVYIENNDINTTNINTENEAEMKMKCKDKMKLKTKSKTSKTQINTKQNTKNEAEMKLKSEAEMKMKGEAEMKLKTKSKTPKKQINTKKYTRNEAEMKLKNEAEKEMKILDLIKKDNDISRSQIANQLNISTSSVYREIEKLKKKGILDRVGGDRGGYWKINQ